jgi:hypothetical protein
MIRMKKLVAVLFGLIRSDIMIGLHKECGKHQ